MFRLLKFSLTSLLIAIFLSSCATVAPTTSTTPSVTRTWAERQTALNQIQNWQLSGKFAAQTAQNSGSASLEWIQRQQSFVISLLGPFGSNGLKLSSQPGSTTLETSDGKRYTASNPEQLLAERWNYHLPVSYLHYWIRGLPVPNIAEQSQFDSYHRLTRLMQQGWQVEFLSYTSVGNIDLPNRITITSASLKVKIIISEWKL